MKLKPITIVGGGLAGLSLGIALRRSGVPARVIEASGYPRHRVCGEFITGLKNATIDRLGIGRVFEGSLRHQNVAWYRGGNPLGVRSLPEPAIALSRYALDARLAVVFQELDGELLTHTRCSPISVTEGWIQASGRMTRPDSPWVGLKLHVRGIALAAELEFHIGKGCYVGLSRVEDDWINVCGLFRRVPVESAARGKILFSHLRAGGLGDLAKRLETGEIRPGSPSAVAGFAFDRKIGDSNQVQLGDACAMIPPFTGDGMAMAISSAALAAEPLVAWARGDCSWVSVQDEIRRLLKDEFSRRLRFAASIHLFILNRWLQPGLEIVFRVSPLLVDRAYLRLH